MELGCSLVGVHLLQGVDLAVGVYLEQTFAQRLHLHTSNGGRRSHELTVYIRGAHAVAVDYRDMAYARAHQALYTPAANAAHAEDDDALRCQRLHHVFAHEQFGALEYFFLFSHCNTNRFLYVQTYFLYVQLYQFFVTSTIFVGCCSLLRRFTTVTTACARLMNARPVMLLLSRAAGVPASPFSQMP